MKTGLLIALALLCAVGTWAQQAPEADAAKATIRIRASELLRRLPGGTNTVVVAGAPQPVAASAATPVAPPPPTVVAPPPVPTPVPVMPPTAPAATAAPTAAVAPPVTTNAVAAVAAADPNAKQTFQQNTLSGDEPIEFDWMNADIQQVLSKYSELTHRSAIMQQGIAGQISFRSSGPLSVEEAIGALESVLLVNGYAIVPMGDKFFKLVPSPYGPQEGLPVFTEEAKPQQFDRLVAQVVRVRYLDPTDVARALGGSGGAPMPGAPQPVAPGGAGASGRVFMHPYGQIIPLPRSSALLLIDTALNVSRLKQIIEYMDTTSETKMETRVYVLENADAGAVYNILQQLIAADQGSTTPGQMGQITPPGTGTSGFAMGRSRPSVASIEESVIMGRVLVNFDLRTNAIILITQEVNFTFFEKIIKALDVKTNQDFKTRVFFLSYADATDMANMLYQLVQGAEPQAVGGRIGGAASSPYTSRTGTTGTGGRTTGLGGSTSGARSSTTGSRTSSSSLGGSSRTGTSRGTLGSSSRTTATGARTTTPTAPGTTGAGTAGANVPQQLIEIIPDVRNNALVVFAPEQDMVSLADVIKQLDVFPPQVSIDVVVAEVTLTDDTTFGVSMFQRAAKGGRAEAGGSKTVSSSSDPLIGAFSDPTKLGNAAAVAGAIPTGGLTYFMTFFRDNLGGLITALAADSRFKVLQTPHLYTANNQAARIFVGESRPVVTSTQNSALGNTLSNYENIDIGVGLQVTPLINPDGVVTFNIYQTVDQVSGSTLINSNSVPIISRREAEALGVTVKDGQIIVLGGLTSNSRQQTVTKTPVLGDIPLLGNLFKTTTWDDKKTELVFFMRPKVIRTLEEAQRYTWGRVENSKELRTMPIRDVEGNSPMQDKRFSEKLKAIDKVDKSEAFTFP